MFWGCTTSKICPKYRCKKPLTKVEIDFGFELLIETVENETFSNFKGFKKTLTNLPEIQSDDVDQIGKCLNDAYTGKRVEISYSEKPKKSVTPIIQDFFLDDIESDIKQMLLSILP